LQQRLQNLFWTLRLALMIAWPAAVTHRGLISVPVLTLRNLIFIVGRTIMLLTPSKNGDLSRDCCPTLRQSLTSWKSNTLHAMSSLEKWDPQLGMGRTKPSSFCPKFEDVVQAASVHGEMAIPDLQDPNLNVFVFSDIEILDTHHLATQQWEHGNALKHPQAARENQVFMFHPHCSPSWHQPRSDRHWPSPISKPKGNDSHRESLDRSQRNALSGNHQEPSQNSPEDPPSIQFYKQEGEEFSICITTRPQPRTTGKWLQELTAKTKHCACKQIVSNLMPMGATNAHAAFMAMVWKMESK
jgi:hypothetical protein